MCSQFVQDICKYLLNAKILLNTTLKHREEKKKKKPKTLENAEVQKITHLPYASYRDF